MAKLVKKSAQKTTKPLLPKGKEPEEPQTTLGKGAYETPPTKHSPLLGFCVNCERYAAHSWVDKLCYICHMEAAGFMFDDEKKLWIKTKGKK